ncbi:ABC transporter substrate-binding protein [Aliiglaciecola sp. CAU 1673]|uniref:substrate-binding periplasmic protein n=1 Tax=Aliiglaciecola sp. CAU 1673 TaxID=3032595 RepID=UPI0023DB6550|nr:ABC transporter substrate-binding protein [Aliiglaciecola sp. CAU 1673]MDF2180265.1 ABC transporter substrate-binding protein [Aliiglaciecola sp. CAU 1673]
MLKMMVSLPTFFICGFSFMAQAKEIDVAFGWSKPPYVIEKEERGFELELVRNVLKRLDLDMNPVFVPFGRSHYLLKMGKVEAAVTLKESMDVGEAHLSDIYINYHNVAISLKGRDIVINAVNDLFPHSVVAFQNASVVLGDEFSQISEGARFYLEMPDQSKQVEMLLRAKTDVVVMDVNIFNYLSRHLTGRPFMDNVVVHEIFPATRYRVGFVDAQVRDAFNRELAAYRESPEYQALVDKYEFILAN